MEEVRARFSKGEKLGELWTVLFWESFIKNVSSLNLIRAVH